MAHGDRYCGACGTRVERRGERAFTVNKGAPVPGPLRPAVVLMLNGRLLERSVCARCIEQGTRLDLVARAVGGNTDVPIVGES